MPEKPPWIFHENKTGAVETIDLACGCRVSLSPGAHALMFERPDGTLVCELHSGQKMRVGEKAR